MDIIYNYILHNKQVPIQLLLKDFFSVKDVNFIVDNGYCTSHDEFIIIDKPDTFFDILIELKKYDLALDYLEILRKNNNDVNKKQDYNYYYYLLSYLTNLNDTQKEYVSLIKYDDVKILDKQICFIAGMVNGVRRRTIKGRFEDAKIDDEKVAAMYKNRNVKYDISQSKMINDIVIKENEKYEILYVLATNERYEELLIYLDYLNKNRVLTRYERAMLTLVCDFINLQKGINEEVYTNRGDSFVENVLIKNYHYALYLSETCEEKQTHLKEITIITTLLKKVVSYIDQNSNSLIKKRTLK